VRSKEKKGCRRRRAFRPGAQFNLWNQAGAAQHRKTPRLMHTAMALESERKRGELERTWGETDTEKHRQNWPAVSCLACIRVEHTHFLLALTKKNSFLFF